MAVLCAGSLALADTITFNSPAGALGTTQVYTLDGVNFTATAFNGGNLFAKNGGSDEKGLGLTNDSQHEIGPGTPTQFIQLDLLPLITAGFTGFQFLMGSSTVIDAWKVSACASAGSGGSGPPCDSSVNALTGTDELTFHPVPSDFSATNHYLDFSATSGNVLLEELSATPAPEPRFYGLLLTAILGFAGIVIRKRRTLV